MKKILFLLMVAIVLSSCSVSEAEPELLNGILTGNFVEVTPENERTNLIFSTNSNQLRETRSSDGNDSPSRTFSIRILADNTIELSRNEADEPFPRVFHYQIVDGNTFEIGTINQNDPDDTIMIFERD